MIYCHMDMKDDLLEKVVNEEVKGIVIAGFGNNDIPEAWRTQVIPDLLKANKDLLIVRTSIQPYSHSAPTIHLRDQIAAGHLGPAKARILLQLAIATYSKDITKIRKVFGTNYEMLELP